MHVDQNSVNSAESALAGVAVSGANLQNTRQFGEVEVPTGKNAHDFLSTKSLSLLKRGRERRGTGPLGQVVRVLQELKHAPPQLVLVDQDDVVHQSPHDVERHLGGSAVASPSAHVSRGRW